MRNLTLLFFCSALLLLASTLRGQDRAFSIAIQAGPTFSTMKPDPSDAFEQKFRIGFFAGANLRWALSERWSVPIDVQFSQRGFYYNSEGTFIIQNGQFALYRGRVDYRLSYIDIAPQIEFRPIQLLGIAVGPYMSYRMGESVKYGDVIDWTSTKDTELFNDTDLGLTAKLSGNLGTVSLFASFQFGLSDLSNIILTDANGQPVQVLGLKNRAFLVGLGYRI
jgi:hypothetical protein